MATKKSGTTNITLLKLKGTPFKTGKELKSQEDQILREEWQNVERARVRRVLLLKDENRMILAPLLKGFKAKFAVLDSAQENIVHVYLTPDDSVQVEIDNKMKSKDVDNTVERVVTSLLTGLVTGYLSVLGLKNEATVPVRPAKRVASDR